MKNIELIFEKNIDNNKYKVRYDDRTKCFTYFFESTEYNDSFIYEMLSFFNYYHKKYNKYPIRIKLRNINYNDKLVMLLFEVILYYVISKLKINVTMDFNKSKVTISNYGQRFSPLSKINRNEDFVKSFLSNEIKNVYNDDKTEILASHYRKIIKFESVNSDSDFFCKIMTDIECFFENSGISEIKSEELAVAVFELVDNAYEHGQSDVLVDIDITEPKYYKGQDISQIYYGINVVVLEFSNINFHELLKNNLGEKKHLNIHYNNIFNAYKVHSKSFDNTYFEDRFYFIASFQDYISGNLKKQTTGGRGLLKLVKSLQNQADEDMCYIFSGNTILTFDKKYLKIDNNGYIGFNEQNDFLNHIPLKSLFYTTNTYFPGVAYNLSFAIKKEV